MTLDGHKISQAKRGKSKIDSLFTSGKNHFHEMSGDVGMAGWK